MEHNIFKYAYDISKASKGVIMGEGLNLSKEIYSSPIKQYNAVLTLLL